MVVIPPHETHEMAKIGEHHRRGPAMYVSMAVRTFNHWFDTVGNE